MSTAMCAACPLRRQGCLARQLQGLLGAAFFLTRFLSKLLFDVPQTDLVTFVVVSSCLGGIGLLASYIPARRALRVDPMVALRYE